MSYENKEAEYESGAPKKADVLIKSTQTIVAKQEEVVEQTKLAISRIDEAIDLCHKNNEEASYILEHSTEMFDKLQSENSALKQELLYLAKQSENIYSGLAEKLNEMEQEVAPRNSEGEYKALSDELQKLRDQISYIASRLDALGAPQKDALNDKFAILYDKMDAVAKEAAKPAEAVVDNRDILDKLDKIADSMRKNESAHSMLADRFEILSMRVEQLGYGSVKQPMYSPAAPYPVPVQPVQTAEIDYDKLANKVAEILAVKDTVSPDYIASKVAEQIVLPEQLADINTQKLAREVASLIDIRPTVAVADGGVPVEINEDSLAEKIAERLSITADASSVAIDEDSLAEKIAEKLSITADSAPVAIDEDSLAEKIAEKFNVVEEDSEGEESEEVKFDEDAFVEKIVARLGEIIPVGAEDIDQDELADTISLKVGSLKPEDFEILVDDDGCESISREIAQKLDYDFISTHVADKLREILEINAANAPDYEDMAERISEKITVAGINEDAIAEKAAAVLSNYLPEFDTDEIADKVSGAVIDVVAAMPQPTVDSESICNEITERLIEKQEENNYDIVIDDDGISRITAIVTEEIEKNTLDRFNKLEDSVNRIAEMLEPVEVAEDELEGDLAEEEIIEEVLPEELVSRLDKLEDSVNRIAEMLEPVEVAEDELEENYAEEEGDVVDLTESVAEITSRLDRIDEGINKLSDMLVVEEVPEEEYNTATAEEYGEEPVEDVYVTEEVSEELAARFDKLEGDIAKIYDIVSGIVVEDTEEETEEDLGEVEENETEEYLDEQISEEDYQTISDMFTSLSARFDGVEQKIDSLSELISVEEEYAEDAEEEVSEGDEEYAEEEYAEELEEEEYAKLSEIIESRFNSVEQKLDSLKQLVGSAEPVTALSEPVTDDNYITLSEIVATEVENSVAYRFDGIEEQIAKISDIIAGLAVGGAVSVSGVVSDRVSDEALNARLDKISEDIKEISEYVQGDAPVAVNERLDKLACDIEKIAQLLEGGLPLELTAQIDKLQEEVGKLSDTVVVNNDENERLEQVAGGVNEIKEMLASGATVVSTEETAASVAEAEEAEEQELVTVSEIVKPIQIDDEEGDGDFILSALDMDSFSDDERMPGELGDLDGVDFENMMKYNRSFIARIIQSDDDCKQYYGEVKHALLSYKKVNSNVAWSNERFNKGRETIARMKIRGKTLVVYLALDPNEYKTSVYHHTDVSDNNSVQGTPMMIKVKSPLGVRKAIRLIDEMLEKRGAEKREIPERNYSAMYPYETVEELIEDGLIKDVRKK